MKKFVVFLLILIGVVAVVCYTPSYRQQAIAYLSYSECDQPLQYKIGSISPRFGLSKSQVLGDIQTATNLWSQAEGKSLFEYSPQAALTVNFVYDQRQALDTQITQLNSKLDQNSKTLQQQIDAYHSQVADFEQKLAGFKSTVDQYNAEGGAPPDIYNQLMQEQRDLQTEANTLNTRARELNLSTQNYNTDVSTLNQDVNQFNQAISQKPEEGLYNGGNNTITIYFASNHQELLHTLAHEFGHSLGMVHVKDPNAIMYPYTTSTFTPTPDDLQQLHYVCREQSAIVHWAEEFDLWLISQVQNFKINK